MKTYQYQIIKYVHDHFTGEFVNIGVVVYDPETKYLGCKVTKKYKRISNFFPSSDGKRVLQLLQYFEKAIQLKAKELIGLFSPSISLTDVTSSIILKDNSAIQYSIIKTAIDVDLDAALNDLYNDLVGKYDHDKDVQKSLTDDDVWRMKYKKYFDDAGISSKLKSHVIKTKNDDFKFEKAWKNEIWHCYEPLSFELQNKDAIKDKVYKWAGKLQGMQQTQEKLNITLLSALNPEFSDMKKFINEYLDVNNENIDVDIVFDDQAQKVVSKIMLEMEEHEKHN
jgi:Protein of unknown function (DUF3037)